MTGEKERKSSDLSARLKRPLNKTSRPAKAPSPSRISTPPKAALASSSKPKKDEVHRRKNPFHEMLLHKSGKEPSSSIPSIQDENEDGHDQDPHSERQHTRNTSIESIKSITESRVADHVAELERALAVARAEQDALREELDKVRQHGVVYRETIEDYRRQLNDAYHHNHSHGSRSESPIIEYEEEVEPHRRRSRQREELIEQNYELRSKLADLQEQYVAQDAAYRHRLDQQMSTRDSEWSELTVRLHHSEKESQERLQQLLDLKHSISALTRMESQVTDSELAERIDQLYHRVREWVISNFRRTKLDFVNVSKDTLKALGSITSEPASIDSTDRLAFYQSIVSSYIMQLFREPICIGLPETGPLAPIRQLAAYIHDAGSDYREWRRSTIRALEKSIAKQQLQAEKERVLHNLVGEIRDLLFDLTSVNLSQPAQASLFGILLTAADLQQALLLQKAQYKVEFFRNFRNEEGEGHRTAFDPAQMENINAEMDEDDVFKEKTLSFCVFPCLEKFGDEVGENSQVRNVLLKARVCCGVG
ncbi:hypothetical protein BDV96DRAFT_376991 [Lophiotrema nucula]|uniref:Uncharacterized protein n=1 Tax=Lophiotrema nucula TaxID=690887 RepID=A0A6A5YDI4_9PLEO|nr:hypothetical protein BDV96DRAFT_376991 [Lophiotrema nucula]